MKVEFQDKSKEILVKDNSKVELVYKIETQVQLNHPIVLKAIYLNSVDKEEQVGQIQVQLKDPKKYKIVFPFQLNFKECSNVYELLETKAILIDMSYQDKVINRQMIFINAQDTKNEYQLLDAIAPKEIKEEDQVDQVVEEHEEGEEFEEFEEGEEYEEGEEIEEIQEDLSEENAQLINNYYKNESLKKINVTYPYSRFDFRLSIVQRSESNIIMIDQE